MNRVYKVIWSKAKHCYVVTSEIARSVTKSASSARSAGRKGAAVLAMAALLFTAGGVLGEAANIMDVTGSSEAKDVILVKKDDGTTTPITINDVEHAINANSDGDGLIIKENYVKNADARVSTDGEYVKKDKKVGENLSALDTQVKANKDHIDAFVPVAQQVGANAEALGKLDQKVKDNLKVGDGGVISKVTGDDSTPSSPVNKLVLNKDGEHQITLSDKGIKVGLNSGVMDKDGFYAGGDTADTAMAALKADGKIKGANGAFTVDENGNVASKATITGETVTDGKGASMSNGTVTGGTVTSTGNISALGDIHANGAITGASASFIGDIHANGTITGASASFIGDIHANGAIQGKSISDGTATMQNGNLTGVKNLSAETITTTGNATIGGALTVTGKLNMDEIYMTKVGIVGDNNVKSSSTKVAAGEITSYKDAISTKDGSEKESAIDYDEKGTSTWAKATDADGKWNKSSLTVEGKGIKSIATDGTNNASTNLSNNGFNTYASDGKNKTYTKQTATDIKNTAEKGMISNTAKNLVNRAYENMTNTVDKDLTTTVGGNETHAVTGNQTVTVSKDRTVNVKGTETENFNAQVTNVKTDQKTSVGGNQTNIVTGNQQNTVSGSKTETVKGAVTEKYGSQATTVDGDQSTKVGGNETHAVTGNQTVTVSKDRTVNVKGTETENFNAQVTNVKTDQKTSVGGNQTNIVTGNQQNTVSGSKTETVKGAVTEKYGSQATTVDGDQSTKVGGNETHAVTGNQTVTVSKDRTVNVKGTETENFNAQVTNVKTDQKTSVGGNQTNIVTGNQQNTVSGSKTESVKGAVSETYGSQNTKVNGDQSTTVTGKQTNSITGDQVNTIGGNQTTTVTGDSSLSANNITNTASEKITNQIGNGSAVKSEMTANGITNTAKEGTIYNKSKDILNEASGDIINWADGEIGNVVTKITNITGDNTVTSDTNGTTFENKAHNTAVKEGTVTKTTISGNTIETGQATMDYADVTKDLSVGGNATVENDLTVKGTSEFVGEAHFRYDVYVDNNLTVAKETRTDTLYVDHDGYVGGNLNVDGNIETHDAVLSADSRQVVTGRQLYQTNERVDRLDNRIKKVGANAAALAALRPGDFNPDDKFSIAAGFGSYRNANAAALGLFYRPNENVLLSLGTSFGDGENMVNAGVSVKFGRGKSMAERRKEMADEVSSMRDEMRSQDERIAELEEMLKKQSELIEKLSKES